MMGQLIPQHIRIVWRTDAPVSRVKADPGQIQKDIDERFGLRARPLSPALGICGGDGSRHPALVPFWRTQPHQKIQCGANETGFAVKVFMFRAPNDCGLLVHAV